MQIKWTIIPIQNECLAFCQSDVHHSPYPSVLKWKGEKVKRKKEKKKKVKSKKDKSEKDKK